LSTCEIAEAAKRAARALAPLDEARRNAALAAMANAVAAASAELLVANAEDMLLAESLRGAEALGPATMAKLKLTPARLAEMVEQIRSVAALPDPLGRKLDAIELDTALQMEKVSVPLGALALKSGNAVILKPGREVEQTAVALVSVLRAALAEQGLPQDAVALVLGRERVHELLAMHELVDMVIPRGTKALVEYVQANTRIPVLGHAEGVCHIYVDKEADQAMALRVIEDAKTDYPAACNAVETVLVHREIAAEFLPRFAERCLARGIVMHGDALTQMLMRDIPTISTVDDWHTEYGELELSIGVVASLDAAMEHIQEHGSVHTESIITENAAAAERFLREVDAASVMHNASTRFADGFRYGFGAEVGISTSKFHARGPVGLEGLTTYKYVVRGKGQIAGDYRGENPRAFTHRRNA
jgi:glutamate-5-semialdehyde dehydrogenase